MITNMFDGSNFKYDSSSENMSYDEIIVPVTGRRMLTICGELDTTVPYYGGSGVWQNQFFPAQESVYIWAQHMGFREVRFLIIMEYHIQDIMIW